MSRSLREYAAESKRSLYEIAQAAGVDDGDIYAIADGRKGCRPETAAKIRLATEGQVTEFDLLRARLTWLAENPEPKKRGAGKKAAKRPFGVGKPEAA
jgi:hypothetical protein